MEAIILGTAGFLAWYQGFYALGLIAFAVATLLLINGLRSY